MLNISKGTVMPNSTEQLLFINHCGKVLYIDRTGGSDLA